MSSKLPEQRARGSDAYTVACIVAMILATAALAAAAGITPWSVVLILFFLSCPVAAAWAYIASQRPLAIPVGPPVKTSGVALNWIAPWYDSLCRLIGLGPAFRRQTLEVAALQPGERVLDVGCGTGTLTRQAAEAVGPNGQVTGIDPAEDMIRTALLTKPPQPKHLTFHVAAVESLPFGAGEFDVVLLSLVLHHLPLAVKRRGMQEIARVLKPGGRLIVVDFERAFRPLGRAAGAVPTFGPAVGTHLDGQTAALIGGDWFTPPRPILHWWGGLLTFWRAIRHCPSSLR